MNKPSTPILVAAIALSAFAAPASAVNYPITQQQRAVADKVAQAGVPLSELAPNAPDSYTVVRGDTLWDISSKFLTSPWRWPELWGMNRDQIRNPHLIYPGQILYLERIGDRAQLRVGEPVGGDGVDVALAHDDAGHPLIGAFTAHKSGHALNNRLVRETLSRAECWEIASFEEASAAPPAIARIYAPA